MKIEAITTCVGESALRMLSFTYHKNKHIFDNFIVATITTDFYTREFCYKNNIQVIATDAFFKYKFKFNKGAAINEAIKLIDTKSYICHTDSDILYPHNYRDILENELLDTEYFYGSRRTIVETEQQLKNLFSGKDDGSLLTTYIGIGYGYSQIWSNESSIVKSGAIYPEIYEKGDSDWKWRNLWGDCVNKDTKYTGKLKRISANVLHLGLPDISGADNFWNK